MTHTAGHSCVTPPVNSMPVERVRAGIRHHPAWVVLLVILLQACGVIQERNAPPQDLVDEAYIPGLNHSTARFWGDAPPPYTQELVSFSDAEVRESFPLIYGREHHLLAISGGGGEGAFGAGLLAGWTASGTRPEFTMVTGVSVGGLIAPFAFLGSEYDEQLKELFTTSSSKDIFVKNPLSRIRNATALKDTAPLRALLDKYITDEMLEKIAQQHRGGRRLLIGTANIDALRPVTWSIGMIADSGVPGAGDLIRDIMLASASIPVNFPPVSIEVEAGGRRYEELHVDGGIVSQVFLYPLGLDWRRLEEKLAVKGTPQVYLIRNSMMDPRWVATERKLITIGVRSLYSLIRSQGLGDVYKIFLGAKRDGLDFNLAYIPRDFNAVPNEAFDMEFMNKLFERGYNMAKQGYPWEKSPPGLYIGPEHQ